MRLKLVLLTSLIGAVIGAGASIAIIVATLGSWMKLADPALSKSGGTSVIFLIPLTTAGIGSFFVYRHTARRRKLQAALTGILILLLCLMTFIAAILGLFNL
jgi:hypothetical protein